MLHPDQNLSITVLSMLRIPNAIYAVDLHRAVHKNTGNQIYFSYGFKAIGEKHLITEVTLSFPEFVSVHKKSGYSITSCDNTGHT